jgi:cellulose synthase/poly-beta-1,6-N-acetylglucosamine synthase-like glycosyltransferase
MSGHGLAAWGLIEGLGTISLTLAASALAALPAMLFFRNLSLFRPPPVPVAGSVRPRVSILIPARDEERAIEGAVRAALASAEVEVELLVLDDHSSDRTAAIVEGIAAIDRRLRLVTAPLLPPGWCGKQHACARLAERAAGDWLLFLDADVRLAPDAASRLVAFAETSSAALVSGFPRPARCSNGCAFR